ncbi:MAG: hypothetical protein Ct9H300mP3_01340 [Gammaproteobacteria bacterium]|nr:MAG: hypothetical protein Ct9H300mP3_01340 [Gammaproteobacteria bacterium]
MKVRFLFRILGTTFVIGLITIGIYALGVQFNWYGELEGRGDLIEQPYPSKLLLEKKQKQLKVNPSPKQILFGILMCIQLIPLMPFYGVSQY